jgi:hypothetical protein
MCIYFQVMQDIVTNMFSEKFLEEIFKPQELCSRKALRTIFERLAHTSIMRLNESSMDKVNILFLAWNLKMTNCLSTLFKLFDLMTMAVKYQTTLVTRPREILLVTLNHLDSIMPFINDSAPCVQMVEQCYKRLFKVNFNWLVYVSLDIIILKKMFHLRLIIAWQITSCSSFVTPCWISFKILKLKYLFFSKSLIIIYWH